MNAWTQRKLLFSTIFLLSLFIVLFVGREKSLETGIRQLQIVSNGISHFRKGLDVSGGTKLVYKISYDKYEKIYSDPIELASVKKSIETIILQNIDKRISKLGVSDYRSYVELINDDPYVVVEIGGIYDLEEAKSIIGRVVQLEFKFPNEQEPSQETKDLRKMLAKKMIDDVINLGISMEDVSKNKASNNIYYNIFSGSKLNAIPLIYQENIDIVDSMKKGQIYEGMLDGIYTFIQNQDSEGQFSQSPINGFTTFRLIDRIEKEREILVADDIHFAGRQLGIDLEQQFSFDIPNVADGQYLYSDSKFEYNAGQMAENQEAYDLKVYSIIKNTSIGKSDEEIQKETLDYDNKLLKLKEFMLGENGSLEEVDGLEDIVLVNDGWTENSTLTQSIDGFVGSNIGDIKIFPQIGYDLVVYFKNKKSSDKPLYQTLKSENISLNDWSKLESLLKKEVLYSIEDIFVQDRETRVLASDIRTKDNKEEIRILDGAYFKYANVGRDQVGQPVVVINLDDAGKDVFCNITDKNIGKSMAIFVGGEIKTAPTINSKICGGTAQIEGGFTSIDAKKLVDDLNEGNMPADLILMQEEKISPTLGENALKGALIAGIVGIVAIFLMMFYMYGIKKAFVTFFVLFVFITVLGAFMKLIDYALSLSGIAAIILSIGMCVDANVLIFERIREELNDKKTMKSAIQSGYDRSRAPIRDGNVSTGLIALLLFTLGINMFKGFGSMMILNTILILFLNVPFTKFLLELVFHNKKSYGNQ